MKKRDIAILGATGSIGSQALDIVRRYPDRFYACCLTARSSAEEMFSLVREFRPRVAALEIEPDVIPDDVKFCSWIFGKNCSAKAVAVCEADDAMCAIVGIAGLDAVWTALDHCKRILLANKEALVAGGRLVMDKAEVNGVELLPVDSEHSAIYQCLNASQGNKVNRIILTASGGALRTWPAEKLRLARVDDVLKHPTWNMGGKITVDCATMLNKGLEVIEAHYLFHMPVDRIDVVVHPESIIHSMIEFNDGAVLAQMAMPDMRGPIGYAMGHPERLPYSAKPLDFATLGRMTFEEPDVERFPLLATAYAAIRTGGRAPIVLNSSNEEANAAFLSGKIGFADISNVVQKALECVSQGRINSIGDVYFTDELARSEAKGIIKKLV